MPAISSTARHSAFRLAPPGNVSHIFAIVRQGDGIRPCRNIAANHAADLLHSPADQRCIVAHAAVRGRKMRDDMNRYMPHFRDAHTIP